MNIKLKSTLRNIFYAFVANGISTIISAILTLVVPKLFGVKEYSYWQLYIFYTSYVGFFHLGWIDGIYLKYGGKEYSELEYPKFVTQFWLINIFVTIMVIAASIFAFTHVGDYDKRIILIATFLCAFVTISKTYFLYIFELTNRIKEYARYIKVDRYIYFIITMLFLFIGVRDYKLLILADVISRIIALIMCIKSAKEVAFGKLDYFKNGIKEAIDNISIGSKLMIANVASMLIIGIVRFAIERKWDIETFGKVSLTLSISNFLLTMINAIGVVMFPLLRRTNKEKLSSMYIVMRTFMMILLLAMLVFYMPFEMILSMWLPKYKESLKYMALLFPIFIFECKMSLLINTFLKTLRKEKWILLTNVTTLILSIIVTGITVFAIGNLTLTVSLIVVLLAFKCVLAESLLARYMKIDVHIDIILEVTMVSIFMVSSWRIGGLMSLLIYLIAYVIYFIIKIKDIKNAIKFIKPLLKFNKVEVA